MKPTLLVLAAGMGSRYGGLKQMDSFGPNGETILDYSIYDAIQAGFGKVVFVIRESFSEAFRAFFDQKLDGRIQVEYVFQNMDDLPDNADYDTERTKPWGTAHAVWVARHSVNEPFVVINADDFYGRGAFDQVVSYFNENESDNYALIGYRLDKTLSLHGTVNRGVCQVSADSTLSGIEEVLKIGFTDDGRISYPTEKGARYLTADTIVSMNFWAFYPDYFKYCSKMLSEFIGERGHEEKSEFFIPLLVEQLISADEKKIDVVQCEEEWFGVTYQKDKPFVQDRIKKLIDREVYPKTLWK